MTKETTKMSLVGRWESFDKQYVANIQRVAPSSEIYEFCIISTVNLRSNVEMNNTRKRIIMMIETYDLYKVEPKKKNLIRSTPYWAFYLMGFTTLTLAIQYGEMGLKLLGWMFTAMSLVTTSIGLIKVILSKPKKR